MKSTTLPFLDEGVPAAMRRCLSPGLFAALLSSVTSSIAAPGDMRVGVFEGEWCGMSARFVIETRRGADWVFDGHVLIHGTGEYDVLKVTQFEDNSLKMFRYLAGANTGQRQRTTTHPPSFSADDNGGRRAHFATKGRGGYGCSGPTSFSYPTD